FLERRVDVVEMDVGDESIHCRIDAAGLGSEYVSAAGKQIRKRIEIGDATGVGVSRFVTSDALKVVALEIEFPGAFQGFHRQHRVGVNKQIPEARPEAIVLPARVRHHPIEIIKRSPDEKMGGSLGRRQPVIASLSPMVASSSTI